MKFRNIFKPITSSTKKIEYSDIVLQAVLDPRISGLCLNFNGGFDWIDLKYRFIHLLLQRGQIKCIKSGSDLLATEEYITVLMKGFQFSSVSRFATQVILEERFSTKRTAYASGKRIKAAQEKLHAAALQRGA